MATQAMLQSGPADDRSWTDRVRRFRPVLRDLFALLVVAAAYVAIFLATRDQPLPLILQAVARNALSLALAAMAARPLVRRALTLRPVWRLPAHAALAASFSLVWLWLLTVGGALLGAESPLRFTVNPFLVGPAAEWQIFQGVFVYGFLAALLALEHRPGRAAGLVLVDDKPLAEKFFIRSGEGVAPLPVSQIVVVRGADDYSDVVTLDGAHLVQTRLSEFQSALEGHRFLRVHRSAIVNLDRVSRVDPSGDGRLVLTMQTGLIIQASRNGSKLLRDQLL